MKQACGKLCGLEGYCGKELRGRRVPAAMAVGNEKHVLSSVDGSSHALLKFRVMALGVKQKQSGCGRSATPREGALENKSPKQRVL